MSLRFIGVLVGSCDVLVEGCELAKMNVVRWINLRKALQGHRIIVTADLIAAHMTPSVGQRVV